MSRNAPPPIFLQRASYRQRRLRDAARLMPFVGMVLWAIPLSWQTAEDGSEEGTSGLLYVFGVWVLLILLTAFLARRIKGDSRIDDDSGTSGP
ncbi:hypothetical protein [Yoonia sp.]|uniref:hypothetical protein n=1 Tax=Yoonia sp. TaxID=2212373 RepID=UPI002FDAC425